MMSVCTSCCQPRLPRACFPRLLWSFCCPHLIRLLYPRYLLKGVLFPHCPIRSAPPPRFPRHPRPFLNPGKTESPQVAELQPSPVCTVPQALSSCFLLLCLALCLPPQFLHPGLPALSRECFLAIFQDQTLFTF